MLQSRSAQITFIPWSFMFWHFSLLRIKNFFPLSLQDTLFIHLCWPDLTYILPICYGLWLYFFAQNSRHYDQIIFILLPHTDYIPVPCTEQVFNERWVYYNWTHYNPMYAISCITGVGFVCLFVFQNFYYISRQSEVFQNSSFFFSLLLQNVMTVRKIRISNISVCG